MNKTYALSDLFDKRTVKGVPKQEENLEENNNGYHVFGQNIKYQYPHRVLMYERYLQVVEPSRPILAYTSSVGEIGMITESFYRTGDNGAFQGLFPKVDIDRQSMLYILTELRKIFDDFGYATSMTNIMNLKIQLPVIESSDIDHKYTIDDIDWSYMHERISDLERERIMDLDAYLQVTGLNNCELTEEDKKALSEKPDFGKFVMHDLFELLSVKKAVKANVRSKQDAEFCVPVVYAKFGDNGIMYWGRKGEFTTYKNVLSIVYNGVISAGKCYAQEDETGILAESYLIRYINGPVPFLANLYMSQIIEHTIYPLYSRDNLAIWNDRVENDIIELPIKSDGTPDLDYMERYIRAMEKVVVADVVNYKDKIISNT